MFCVVDIFFERFNLSNKSIIKIIKILFHDNANDNENNIANNDYKNIAHIFNDYSNKSISTIIQTNIIQK